MRGCCYSFYMSGFTLHNETWKDLRPSGWQENYLSFDRKMEVIKMTTSGEKRSFMYYNAHQDQNKQAVRSEDYCFTLQFANDSFQKNDFRQLF